MYRYKLQEGTPAKMKEDATQVIPYTSTVKTTTTDCELVLYDKPVRVQGMVQPVQAALLFKDYVIPLDSEFISKVMAQPRGTMTVLDCGTGKRLRLRYAHKHDAFACHCLRLDKPTVSQIETTVKHHEQVSKLV